MKFEVGDKVMCCYLDPVFNQKFRGKSGIITRIGARNTFYVELNNCWCSAKGNHVHWFNQEELILLPNKISKLRLKFLELLYICK